MKKKNKKVTMQDIADDLNVSKGLVSLALRDKYGVSEETRSKIVLRAIELGYKIPPKAAEQRLFTIIINDISAMRESFWSKIISGIEASMNQYHFSINVAIWNYTRDEFIFINQIMKSKPKGVIIVNECDDRMLYILKQLNLPVVLVDIRHPIPMIYDHVYANNYDSGFEGTRYLANKGHKHIAFVGYIEYSHSFNERYKGFRAYMNSKPSFQIETVISAPNNHEKIFNEEELRNIMNKDNHPTALFCANDPVALQVYKILKEMNFKIPQDVSVLGFDNIDSCSYQSPPLSSINIPKEEIGEQAVNLLIDRIKYPQKAIKNMQLSTHVVERGSVLTINEKGEEV